ncbi:MAG: DnaJ domain-containing protein [Leptospirillia bacterium]
MEIGPAGHCRDGEGSPLGKSPEEIKRELAAHIGRMACLCRDSSWLCLERSLDLDWGGGGGGEMEEKFSDLDRLFSGLLDEISRDGSRLSLSRVARKSEFLEDRFEELDSLLRNRPRRKRAALPWEKFFRAAAEGEDPNGRTGRELLGKHCRTLGVPETASLDEIRRKVRTLLKEHHPDMRSGDRSGEGRMREILESYAFLKKIFGEKL